MWSRVRALPGRGVGAPGGRPAHVGAVTARPRPTRPSPRGAPAAAVVRGVRRGTPRRAVAGPVVALGDSYTAGALLPIDPHAAPPGCLRSAKAYPVLVAARAAARR